MNVNKFCLVSLSILLFACGNKDKENFEGWPKYSAPVATVPIGLKSQLEDPSLLGSWQGKCGVSDGKSYLLNVEFKPDFLVYSKTWYQDLFCKTETSSFRFFSEYRTDSGKVFAQIAEAHIKIENEVIRVAAEKSKSCGFDIWLASTWYNVTGHTCPRTETTGGVWSDWTMPGKVILNQPYEVLDNKLTFFYANSSTEFTKQ